MNPKMNDVFALVAGAAVILGGAWWMLSRRAVAAPVVVRQAWEPSTFTGAPGNTAEYQAWVDENYYGPSGAPIVLDARDAWAQRASAPVPTSDASDVIYDARDAWARR